MNWILVAWSATITAALGVWTAYTAVRQRQRDLRFRQTELALKLVSEVTDYAPSGAALELLDERSAVFPKDAKSALRYESIPRALQIPPDRTDDSLPRIRRCFDALLFYLDRFERLIDVEALKFEDVEMPWKWYVRQLVPLKAELSRYIEYINYGHALRFLERYSEWRDAQPRGLQRTETAKCAVPPLRP